MTYGEYFNIYINSEQFIFGTNLKGNALNSKSDLEKVFLTHEQKLRKSIL